MQQFARTLGIDPSGKNDVALFDAIRASAVPAARIPELVKAQVAEALTAERARIDGESKKRRATILMEALPKTYPGDREALQRLAERDPDEALKLAKPFLPPAEAPRLFDMLTREGAPIGEPGGTGARGPRDERPAAAAQATKTKSGAIIFSADAQLADKAKEIAESKDPVLMARLDALLPTAGDRANPAFRLFKAQELAAQLYPDLAAAAEQAELQVAVNISRG
jgi:hypothetical protein